MIDPHALSPGSLTLVGHPHTAAKRLKPQAEIAWNRRELNAILSVYGRKVAEGEWRDYAIDMLKDAAVFSVFRRSSEVPLYRIEKRPKLTHRQGAYAVIAATGLIVKRGHELAQVLKVFEKKKLTLVDA